MNRTIVRKIVAAFKKKLVAFTSSEYCINSMTRSIRLNNK